jgi:hypothetical protein
MCLYVCAFLYISIWGTYRQRGLGGIGVSWYEGIYVHICVYMCVHFYVYPFEVHTDREVWGVLESVDMKVYICVQYLYHIDWLYVFYIGENRLYETLIHAVIITSKTSYVYVHVCVGGLGGIGASWYEGVYIYICFMPYWLYVDM